MPSATITAHLHIKICLIKLFFKFHLTLLAWDLNPTCDTPVLHLIKSYRLFTTPFNYSVIHTYVYHPSWLECYRFSQRQATS